MIKKVVGKLQNQQILLFDIIQLKKQQQLKIQKFEQQQQQKNPGCKKMLQKSQSEIQQKNQNYKNQIRKKMKVNYIKKLRNQFLRSQQINKYYQDKSKYTINNLQYLINQSSNNINLALINRIIIDKRQQLTQNMYKNLIQLINKNLIESEVQIIIKKKQLNDYIALLGNLLVCDNYRNVVLQLFNFSSIINQMINLIKSTNQQTGSLILWILFQITLICPNISITRIASIQLDLKNKIGLQDVHLSYLFLSLSQSYQNLIEPQIIQGYTLVDINRNTEVYFCQNVAYIFDIFLRLNKLLSITQLILDWISRNLISQQFPPLAKTQLFQLLHNIIQISIQQNTLITLINQGTIITELIQRSLFDSSHQNKIICIKCIIALIKKCSKQFIGEFILNYPTIIQVLVQSISLFDLEFSINSLGAITWIIVSQPQNNEIKQIIINSKLRYELKMLSMSKSTQISELANSILQEYLNQ